MTEVEDQVVPRPIGQRTKHVDAKLDRCGRDLRLGKSTLLIRRQHVLSLENRPDELTTRETAPAAPRARAAAARRRSAFALSRRGARRAGGCWMRRTAAPARGSPPCS